MNMNSEDYIPKNYGDVAAVDRLKRLPFESVRKDIPALLEWLQDGHWYVAEGIAKYLLPHVNEIAQDLLFIFDGEDSMWKYCIINILIARSPNKLSPSLVEALKRIADHPSKIDAEDTVDDAAKAVIANKVLCG
jgi:hypothetical protein